MSKELQEVSKMLGDAIEKLNSLNDRYRIKPKEKTEHDKYVEYMDQIADVAFSKNPFEHDVDVTASKGVIHIDTNEFKPKEKKKLYLWAVKDKITKSWKLTDRYMESAEDVEQDYCWIDDFYRIDATMIEVENEKG